MSKGEKQHLNLWQRCGPPKFDLRMCFRVCLCFGPVIKKKKKKETVIRGTRVLSPVNPHKHPGSEITG